MSALPEGLSILFLIIGSGWEEAQFKEGILTKMEEEFKPKS
jgi:hypothetical protein